MGMMGMVVPTADRSGPVAARQVDFSTWTLFTGWYTGASVGPGERLTLEMHSRQMKRLEYGSETRGGGQCYETGTTMNSYTHCLHDCFWSEMSARVSHPCQMPQSPYWMSDLPFCQAYEEIEPYVSFYESFTESDALEVSKNCSCELPCHTEVSREQFVSVERRCY